MALVPCCECRKEMADSASTCPHCGAQYRNKWVSLALCIFTVCGHKIYERKYVWAIIYFITAGLCGIGYIFDIISILCKPTHYQVK